MKNFQLRLVNPSESYCFKAPSESDIQTHLTSRYTRERLRDGEVYVQETYGVPTSPWILLHGKSEKPAPVAVAESEGPSLDTKLSTMTAEQYQAATPEEKAAFFSHSVGLGATAVATIGDEVTSLRARIVELEGDLTALRLGFNALQEAHYELLALHKEEIPPPAPTTQSVEG